jgi:hypothetical protein
MQQLEMVLGKYFVKHTARWHILNKSAVIERAFEHRSAMHYLYYLHLVLNNRPRCMVPTEAIKIQQQTYLINIQ